MNTRANRIRKYLNQTLPKYQAHVGHVVTCGDGTKGKLIRVTVDIDQNIKVTLDVGTTFPEIRYAEELKDCDCGKA